MVETLFLNGKKRLFVSVAALMLPLGLAACDSGKAAAENHVPAAQGRQLAKAETTPQSPHTSITALPERTNNAWEITPFKLPGLDGKLHTLDEWKGKIIMMNFWASWCAPCQYEIPEFVQYQEKYRDKGLQFVGIGVDQKQKLANVARSLGVNYPVLVVDPSSAGPLLTRWGNTSGIIPYTVVIAKDGRIKYIHRGQFDDEAFQNYVAPLLK